MQEQGVFQVLLVATGGGIGIAGGVITQYLARRWDRKERRGRDLRDALADWAKRFEETVAHHSNYYRLALGFLSASTNPEAKKAYQDETMRVLRLAGDAGRELDAGHYRVLLLEKRGWIRDKVTELTVATMRKDLTGLPKADEAREYLSGVDDSRRQLQQFLKKLAEADAFN